MLPSMAAAPSESRRYRAKHVRICLPPAPSPPRPRVRLTGYLPRRCTASKALAASSHTFPRRISRSHSNNVPDTHQYPIPHPRHRPLPVFLPAFTLITDARSRSHLSPRIINVFVVSHGSHHPLREPRRDGAPRDSHVCSLTR